MVGAELPESMTPESLALTLICLGILGQLTATLRLLSACKDELSEHMAANHARSETSTGHLEEVVRIGADVADALEGLVSGLPTDVGGASTVLAKPPSLQDTIIELMVERFLAPNHASTGQIGPLQIGAEDTPTTDDNLQPTTTDTP